MVDEEDGVCDGKECRRVDVGCVGIGALFFSNGRWLEMDTTWLEVHEPVLDRSDCFYHLRADKRDDKTKLTSQQLHPQDLQEESTSED